MAYTINLTNGSIFATISDGTTNTDSSLTLPGRNYVGYGELIAENFVRVLESGASLVAPANPLDGQLWYDASTSSIKVYDGTAFKKVGAEVQSTEPVTAAEGDMWYDTSTGQLKVFNGTTYTVVGPAFNAGSGLSGAVVEIISDNIAQDHVVTKLYSEDVLIGIVSKDGSFIPGTPLTGFTTVEPGIQLATSIGAETPVFTGIATDSQLLNGLSASNFLNATANDTTSGSLGVLHDLGLTIGAGSDGRFNVIGDNVILGNVTNDGDLLLQVKPGAGVTTTVITCDGLTARAQVSDPLNGSDIVNRNYLNSTVALALSSVLVDDLTFDILTPVADSKGISWAGNTDYAKIFVESFAGPESSRLVFEIGDDAADYITFKLNNGVSTEEILKVTSTGIDCNTSDITNVGQITATTVDATTVDATTVVTSSVDLPDAAAISQDTITLEGATANDPVTVGNNDLVKLRLESILAPLSRELGFDVGGMSGEAGKFIDGDGDTNRLDMLGNKITNVGTLSANIVNVLTSLDMGSNKITSLLDPTLDQDAATRKFVLDSITASDAITASSTLANGYIKFSTGLVIQWGKSSINANTTITFPIAFPAFCASVVSTPIGSTNGAGTIDFWGVSTATTTQFTQYTQYDGGNKFYWIAMGF